MEFSLIDKKGNVVDTIGANVDDKPYYIRKMLEEHWPNEYTWHVIALDSDYGEKELREDLRTRRWPDDDKDPLRK